MTVQNAYSEDNVRNDKLTNVPPSQVYMYIEK
jgi:hypothetical protein